MGEIGNLFGGNIYNTFCFSGTGGFRRRKIVSLFGELDCFRSRDLFEVVRFESSLRI